MSKRNVVLHLLQATVGRRGSARVISALASLLATRLHEVCTTGKPVGKAPIDWILALLASQRPAVGVYA